MDKIVNLYTLSKIKSNLANLEKQYDQLYEDFDIVLHLSNNGLPYDVISYFLSKHKGNIKEYKKDISFLCNLLIKNKYGIIDLFLKYGFDINENMVIEDIPLVYNLFFYLLLIENDDFKDDKFIFLVTRGIDINYRIDDPNGVFNDIRDFSMLDIIISESLDFNNKETLSPYFEYTNFIFNYYKTINNNVFLHLIFLGKEKKTISKKNFSHLVQKHIKFIDINSFNIAVPTKIVKCESLEMVELFLSYFGKKVFFKSRFYYIMKYVAFNDNESDFINSIEKLYNNNNNNKKSSSFDNHILFEKIKNKNIKNIKNILKKVDNINIRNDENKTPLIYAIPYSSNKPEILNMILKYNPNKDLVDNNKSTALHIACHYNNDWIIPRLITPTNVNLKNKDGNTPLMIAVKQENYKCVRALLNSSFNVNVNIKDTNKDTPIVYMLKNGKSDSQIFQQLISHGATFDYYQLKNELLLNIVNNKRLITSIIEYGLNLVINKKQFHITIPLIFSLKENLIDLSNVLLECYDVVQEKDENNKPYIFYTIENKSEEYFNSLIDSKKFNIEEKDNKGKIPLIYAIELKKLNVVKKLLYYYINTYEKEENKINSLNDIVSSYTPEIMEVLSKYNELNYPQIKDSILKVKEIKIELKLKNKVNDENIPIENKNEDLSNCKNNVFNENYSINSIDANEYNVLMTACLTGNKTIIESLINTQIFDINKRIGNEQLTPLMILICNENYDCVNLLIENCADVNIKDIYGNTPLTYMLKYSKLNNDVYNLLINHGAYIEFELFKDNRFIDQIITNTLFLDLFVNKKIKVKYLNNEKSTIISSPLKFSIELNDEKFIKTLLNNSIAKEELYKNAIELLNIANKHNNPQIIELLNNYLYDKNKKYQTKINPRNIIDNKKDTSKKSDEQLAKNSIKISEIKQINNETKEPGNETYDNKYNYSMYKQNTYDYPPIHMSCIEGNIEMIEILLSYIVDDTLNKPIGEYLFTPLMILIFNQNYECAKLLIKSNANVNIKDIYGNTPLTFMLKYSFINEEIYDLLIKHDAYVDYDKFKDNEFINSIIKNEVFIKLYVNKVMKVKYNNEMESTAITTPLIFAINLNDVKFIEILLNKNIKIDELDKDGNDPVSVANKMGNQDIIKLINNYSSINIMNNNERKIKNDIKKYEKGSSGNNIGNENKPMKNEFINDSNIKEDIKKVSKNNNNTNIKEDIKEVSKNNNNNNNNIKEDIKEVSKNNNINNIKEDIKESYKGINNNIVIINKDKININSIEKNIESNKSTEVQLREVKFNDEQISNKEYNINDLDNENINDYPELHIGCIHGDTDMINILLEMGDFNINERAGKYKITPLMLLIIKEDYVNAKYFIEKDADVNIRDINNNTPFIYMLKYSKINEEIYDLLLEHDAYIDYELFKNYNFVKSIIQNSSFIKLYINKKIKVKHSSNSETIIITEPLITSININNVDFVKALLNNKINIDEKDKNDNDPIMVARTINNEEIIKLLEKYSDHPKNEIKLLKNDNNKNIINDFKNETILNEIENDNKNIFKNDELNSINSELKNINNNTNENNSVKNKMEINKTITNNENINEDNKDDSEKSKININKNMDSNNSPEINDTKEKILDKNINLNKSVMNDLKEKYDKSMYKEIINNFSEIHISCIKGNIEMIQLLLNSMDEELDEQLNIKCGIYEFTPLMISIFNENYECAKLLIEKHADVNIKDIYNNTPLSYMIKNLIKNEEIYMSLINHNAFLDIELFKNEDLIKIINKNEIFIKLLLNKKIKISDENGKIQSIREPLIFSIELNNYELSKLLIENNANVNELSDQGNTPLLQAIENGNVEILKLLIQYNVNLKSINNNGKYSLQIAKEKGNKNIIETIENALSNSIKNSSNINHNNNFLLFKNMSSFFNNKPSIFNNNSSSINNNSSSINNNSSLLNNNSSSINNNSSLLNNSSSSINNNSSLLNNSSSSINNNSSLSNNSSSSINNNSSSSNNSFSSINNNSSSYNNYSSSFNNNYSLFKNHSSLYNDNYSSFNDNYSSFNDNYSSFNNDYSSFNGDYSSFNNNYSLFNNNYSSFNNNSSLYKNNYSSFNDHPSSFNDHSSSFNDQSSSFNDQSSLINNPSSSFNDHSSSFNNNTTYYDNYPYDNNYYFENNSELLNINHSLLLTIKDKNIKKTLFYIKKGADVNYENKNGLTPLLCAIDINNIKIIDVLISYGAKVDVFNKNGLSPIKYAVDKADFDIIKTLVTQSIELTNNPHFDLLIDEINSKNLLTVDIMINQLKMDKTKIEHFKNTNMRKIYNNQASNNLFGIINIKHNLLNSRIRNIV